MLIRLTSVDGLPTILGFPWHSVFPSFAKLLRFTFHLNILLECFLLVVFLAAAGGGGGGGAGGGGCGQCYLIICCGAAEWQQNKT